MDASAADRLDQIAAASVRDRILIKARWGALRDMDIELLLGDVPDPDEGW